MSEKEIVKIEDILNNYKGMILRICKAYATDPIEPEDLFQEVIYQVWKSYASFKGNSSLSTWIYKITINVCYRTNLELKKKNPKIVRLESIEFIKEDNEPASADIQHNALYKCIANLKQADKTIVILYLEDLPYKEIASITGLSENHIAVKMKRIRSTLFECITLKLNENA